MDKAYKKIGFNTLIQVVGKVISVGLGFVTVFLLSRYLGTEGYGNFTLAFTFVSFFSVIADFGLQTTMLRELSQAEHHDKYKSFLLLKILLTIAASVAAAITLFFFPYSVMLKYAILIAIVAVAISNVTTSGTIIFQSRLRLDVVTYIDIITKVCTVALIFLFIQLQLNLYYIIATVLLGNLLGMLVTFLMLRGNISLSFNLAQMKNILIMSIPIGITTFLGLASFKIDTIMLSVMKSATDVGLYSLAYKVLENLLVIWGFYMASVYPILSKYHAKHEFENIKTLLRNSVLIAIGMSAGIIFIGFLFAPFVVAIFGGAAFKESIPSLQILLFALPFLFINTLFTDFFFSTKANRFALNAIIVGLISNVLLNIWLIPLYGFIGASYVTVLSSALMSIYCIIQVFFARRVLFNNV